MYFHESYLYQSFLEHLLEDSFTFRIEVSMETSSLEYLTLPIVYSIYPPLMGSSSYMNGNIIQFIIEASFTNKIMRKIRCGR